MFRYNWNLFSQPFIFTGVLWTLIVITSSSDNVGIQESEHLDTKQGLGDYHYSRVSRLSSYSYPDLSYPDVSYPKSTGDDDDDDDEMKKVLFESMVDVLDALNVVDLYSKSADQSYEDPSQIDILIENGNGTQCLNDTARFLTAVASGEPWTIPFVDSMGKPGPAITKGWIMFVGNYDQCKASAAPSTASAPGFTGNYCSVTFSIANFTLIHPLWGVCFPSTCSQDEVKEIVGELTKKTGRSVYPSSVECDSDKSLEMTGATIVAIVLVSFLVTMTLLGSVFDLLFVSRPWSTPTSEPEEDSTPDTPNLDNSDEPLNDVTFRSDVSSRGTISPNKTSPLPSPQGASSKSPSKNEPDSEMARGMTSYGASRSDIEPMGASEAYASVSHSASASASDESTPLIPNLNRVRPAANKRVPGGIMGKILLAFSAYSNGKKALNVTQSEDSLRSVHGLRFISMTWVILAHVVAYGGPWAENVLPEFLHLKNTRSADVISNAFVAVDTFFALAGILTAYVAMNKGIGKINWVQFYFHRLWRLTPPYMFVLVFFLGLQKYMGEGAMWGNVQPLDKENCEKHWWTNLFYVNNFAYEYEPCFGHSWYLANDWQFYLVSPLMLVPFYRHWLAGLASCSLFLLVSWVTTFAQSYHRNWPTTMFAGPDPRQSDWFNYYYIMPWCRIGPYVIGILAGYLLFLTNQRRPKIPWWAVIGGWAVASVSALAVLYGIHGDTSGDDLSSRVDAALYNSLARSVWGACVCWVVVACHWGFGGPINAFLSWSPFVVLGRTTYMAYLLHRNLIFIFSNNLGSPFYFNETMLSVLFVGIVVISYVIAFVFMLIAESPMLGIEKVLMKR